MDGQMLTDEEVPKLFMDMATRSMHVVRSFVRAEADPHTTVPQFRILAAINRGLDQISKIAEHIGVSQPAMSRMVDVLMQKGLVAKDSDPIDQRAYIIKLTPNGKQLFNQIKKESEKKIKRKLETMAPEQIAALRNAVTCINNFVQEIREG